MSSTGHKSHNHQTNLVSHEDNGVTDMWLRLNLLGDIKDTRDGERRARRERRKRDKNLES